MIPFLKAVWTNTFHLLVDDGRLASGAVLGLLVSWLFAAVAPNDSIRVFAGPLLFGSAVVASLDVGRFHWSDTVPLPLQIGALALFALGMALAVWAMAVNKFFSSVVRIQKERGHHLITSGPYRFVRHPGYTGMLFGGLASPLAMGSWWALAPAAVYALLVLRRAIIEDRFLMESLEGYKAFSGQVRHRLVPGLW